MLTPRIGKLGSPFISIVTNSTPKDLRHLGTEALPHANFFWLFPGPSCRSVPSCVRLQSLEDTARDPWPTSKSSPSPMALEKI